MERKSAIVLAMFGTTVADALPGLVNIRAKMRESFPATPVRLAFTSATVRRVWRERAGAAPCHPDLPPDLAEVFSIRGPLATIAALHAAGYQDLVVQPVQVAPAEEYRDLRHAVQTLATSRIVCEGLRPLHRLVVGKPALGTAENMEDAGGECVEIARALAGDVELARSQEAALLYMGHGSRRFLVGPVYESFVKVMRRLYPDVLTLMALMEESPTLDDAVGLLHRHGVRRLVLKPFLVAAGAHVRKDMTGPPPRGWQARLASEGFAVVPVLKGLGEQDSFAAIFVRNTAAAAAEAGISLK